MHVSNNNSTGVSSVLPLFSAWSVSQSLSLSSLLTDSGLWVVWSHSARCSTLYATFHGGLRSTLSCGLIAGVKISGFRITVLHDDYNENILHVEVLWIVWMTTDCASSLLNSLSMKILAIRWITGVLHKTLAYSSLSYTISLQNFIRNFYHKPSLQNLITKPHYSEPPSELRYS